MADASDSKREAPEDAMTVCVTILSKLLAITNQKPEESV